MFVQDILPTITKVGSFTYCLFQIYLDQIVYKISRIIWSWLILNARKNAAKINMAIIQFWSLDYTELKLHAHCT